MADVEITTITIDGKDPKVESITDKATDTMVTDGKPAVRFHEVDGIGVIGMSDDELDFFYSFTPDMKKSMNRKIDMRLLPWLAMLYFVSHLDRGAIGNAKIEGMTQDLGFSGTDYNVALAVFFISYILFELPSNVILKLITRPSWYLGGLTMCYGVIMIGHGLVQNLAGMASMRFVLGIFEAGFFPAAIYLCSSWYMPSEVSVRVGGFYFTGSISGAFAGLLSAAISQLDGVAGYAGWRWIFIIMGIFTVLVGILSCIFLIDVLDENMKWLTADEHRMLLLQYKIKQGGFTAQGKDTDGSSRGLNIKRDLVAIATDWKMWLFVFATIPPAAGFYSLKFTLPSFTNAMGFPGGTTAAQLLSVPPYILGGISSIVLPLISDRQRKRAFWFSVGFLANILGHGIFLGLGGDMSGWRKGLAYFGACIAATGVYPGMPIVTAWLMNNTAPAGRRVLASALAIMFANFGGILGSFQYLDREAPAYPTGFKIAVVTGVTGLLASLILWYTFSKENKKRDKVNIDEVRTMYSDEELLAMGNNSPLFKYTI